jgi:heme-degrading monooxygenase HmoA
MENAPVISINAFSPAPGADSEVYERYEKWALEVYGPLTLKIPEALGIDYYKIVKENTEYPFNVVLAHYRNIKDCSAYASSGEGTAIQQELRSWEERGILEMVWYPVYSLLKGFRSKPRPSSGYETTMIENAPILYFEAFRLSQEEQEKYYKWFNDYGCNIFMPLIMKLPGLLGYDWYEDTGLRRRQDIRELEYPKYLSIIYFENIESYEAYEKSPELAALQKSMRNVFPRGLNLKWHVQYQLEKSWRK